MRARWLTSIGLSLVALHLPAQSSSPPEDPVLAQTRTNVAETVRRLTHYLCSETIERTVYEPAPGARRVSCDKLPNTQIADRDRLHLDVSLGAHGEMYAWSKARKFSDRELFDLVREGAISTGSFGGFLASIFLTGSASFTLHGPYGDGLLEYAFKVPLEKSNYMHGDRDHRIAAGYDGTFLIEASTGDMKQLVIRADHLPPDTAACSSNTTLSYSRVRLKGNSFLLPIESRLTIQSIDGSRSFNRATFSDCREFVGETALRFDDVPDSTTPAPLVKPIVIPPGLSFTVVLTEEIHAQTAAAGDIVAGRLLTPIADKTHVLAPTDSAVTARLLRMRESFDPPGLSLAFQLRSVEIGGVPVDLIAVPDHGKNLVINPRPTIPLGALYGLENRAVVFNFRFSGGAHRIPALKSTWVTANP